MTGREFARKLGVSAESVSRWENGKASPRREHIDKMFKLAPSFRKPLTETRELQPEPPREPDAESGQVALRILEVKPSAGDQRVTVLEEEAGRWLFPAKYYRNLVRHAAADTVVLFVDGDSMLPTLAPNAPVLVLIQKPLRRVDGIWVLRQRELVMVKRLHFSIENPGRITIISDNPRYPQEQLTANDKQPEFDLVGRVIAGIMPY